MFDNQLRTKKHEHGKSTKPDDPDDEGCAVILQVEGEDVKNFLRYDATISRDYYRAIATLEKMQAARRKAEAATAHLERTENIHPENPHPEHVHPEHAHPKPRRDREGALSERIPASQTPMTSIQSPANNELDSIGFVSYPAAGCNCACNCSREAPQYVVAC